MSPTVFQDGPFRFFFFSREEARVHIHVVSPEGEAKVWLEPTISLANHTGLKRRQISRILKTVTDHEEGIREAWYRHFGG